MAYSLSDYLSRWRIGTTGLLILITSVPVCGQGLEDIDPFGEEPAAERPADEGFDIPGFTDEAPVPGLGDEEAPEEETRESVLKEANELAEAEKWDEAIGEYSRILAQNPRDAEAALGRAEAFLVLDAKQPALADLEVAATYGGAFEGVSEKAYTQLGELRLELGQIQEAVDDLDMAIRSNPTDAGLLYLRGKALVRLSGLLGVQGAEQITDAKSTLDRAIKGDPDNAEAYLERSRVFMLQNRIDRAVKDAEMALEKDGQSANLNARSGEVFLSRADRERVRYDADMDQVVNDYSRSVQLFSQHLATEGEKTKDDYDDADPETVTAGQAYLYRSLANMGLATNSASADAHSLYQSVIYDCDRALEFDPDTILALFQKGIAQRLMGDLEAAIDTFTDALYAAPDYVDARLRRGIAYYYMGDMRLARGDFERCLEASADGRAAFWIGATYAREGYFRDAIRYYSQSIRENSEYKPAYSNRALAYMKTERYERAESDYNVLVRLDSDDSEARQRRDMARSMSNR